MDSTEKIKLSGFNNLAKSLTLNAYIIRYSDNDEKRKEKLSVTNKNYDANNLEKILSNITKIMDAKILNTSKHNYEPEGSSATLLIADAVVNHLDKSHIAAHTYPESSTYSNVSSFRIDIDLSTCGEVTPLKVLDYLFDTIDPDIITIDFRVRGFTRDELGNKIHNDQPITSIIDYISDDITTNYCIEEENIIDSNIFYLKMIRKEIDLIDFLIDKSVDDLSEKEQKKAIESIQKEMREIAGFTKEKEISTEISIEKDIRGFMKYSLMRNDSDKLIYSKKSKYQQINIYDTEEYGRVLTLNDDIMVLETMEYIYHESLTHVPLCSHPNPETVLVIGGGDGGMIQEIAKHDCVKRFVLAEIDEEVIKASIEHLPSENGCFLSNDPRLEIKVCDATEYIKNSTNEFDIIIVDTSFLEGFSDGFKRDFYKSIYKSLKKDGIASFGVFGTIHSSFNEVFPITRIYFTEMRQYSYSPYIIGSKTYDPLNIKREAPKKVRWYSVDNHIDSFKRAEKVTKTIDDLNEVMESYILHISAKSKENDKKSTKKNTYIGCSGCNLEYNCCNSSAKSKIGAALIHESEIEGISKATGLSKDEFYLFPNPHYDNHPLGCVRSQSDGGCIFLGKKGCTISEVKPYDCLLFPYFILKKDDHYWLARLTVFCDFHPEEESMKEAEKLAKKLFKLKIIEEYANDAKNLSDAWYETHSKIGPVKS